MKKLLLSILALCTISAYAFEAVNKDGITLYYQYEYAGANNIIIGARLIAPVTTEPYSGDIVIPDSVYSDILAKTLPVTRIDNVAFTSDSLTSVVIGKSVTQIESLAFSGVSGLKALFIERSSPPYANNSFSFDNDVLLFVPNDGLEAYCLDTAYANHFAGINSFDNSKVQVTAVSDDNNAVRISWFAVEGAEKYVTTITLSGAVVAKYETNANGTTTRLQMPAANQMVNDTTVSTTDMYSISINNLQSGNTYQYEQKAVGNDGNTVSNCQGQFSLSDDGSVEHTPYDETSGIDEISVDNSYRSSIRKVVLDGQVYILLDDKVYSILGIEVK